MKRFVVIAFIFVSALTSCSLDDGVDPVTTEVMRIDSVEMPEQFVFGETYEIAITYTRPSICYQFYDFFYEINGQERIIAIVNTVSTGQNVDCVYNPEQVTVNFNFMVTGTETYVFKFYQGENDEGLDQYYLVEVPVAEGRASITN